MFSRTLDSPEETMLMPPPEDWDLVSFPDALSAEVVRIGKVARTQYRKVGVVPVVDQGRGLIAGYWDNPEDAYTGPLPVVVFGDHTRAVKLVEFPFVRGADGTHVLVADRDVFDPEFFYYALLHTSLPNRGYNRHFGLLKECSFPRPELEEQRAIARVLRTVKRAKERTEQVLDASIVLKQSIASEVLASASTPRSRVNLKRVGPMDVPPSWDTLKVSDVCNVVRGSSPRPKGNPKYFSPVATEYPWIMISDLRRFRRGKYLTATAEYLTREGMEKGRLIRAETLLLTNSGTVGIPAILGFDGCIHDGYLAFLELDEGRIRRDFLYFLFEYWTDYLVSLAPKGTQANLNTRILKDLVIPVPPLRVQETIIDALTAADNKVAAESQTRDSLEELSNSLLHELMSGQRRVADRSGIV